MHFKMVVLATDALIYILVILSILLAWHCSKQQHWSRSWRQVFATKRAQVAATVLACFALIGFLDSMHYQVAAKHTGTGDIIHYQPKIYSVLDHLLAPLGQHGERSYSRPLSIYTLDNHNVIQADGSIVRKPERLRYAGQHLNHPQQHHRDVIMLTVKGGVKGIFYWLVLSGCWIIYRLIKYSSPRTKGLGKKWYSSPRTKGLGKREYSSPLPEGDGLGERGLGKWIPLTLLLIFIVSGIVLSLATHYHVLGTDKIGEDVLYQTIKSIRTGLVIGCLTTLVMLPLALIFGALSGYFGGVVDDIIQYFYTTLSSIPGVLLIAAAVLTLDVQMSKHQELFGQHLVRADARLLALCFILGLTSWTSLCRLIRAEVLKLRELEYIQAACALGVRSWKIIFSHLIPNVLHIVLIVIALDFSGLVLAEAVLSYVGVGVDPTAHSWGNMINQARLELAREPVVWWSLAGSFILMFTLVLFANLFADAVRDGFDPRAGTV